MEKDLHVPHWKEHLVSAHGSTEWPSGHSSARQAVPRAQLRSCLAVGCWAARMPSLGFFFEGKADADAPQESGGCPSVQTTVAVLQMRRLRPEWPGAAELGTLPGSVRLGALAHHGAGRVFGGVPQPCSGPGASQSITSTPSPHQRGEVPCFTSAGNLPYDLVPQRRKKAPSAQAGFARFGCLVSVLDVYWGCSRDICRGQRVKLGCDGVATEAPGPRR